MRVATFVFLCAAVGLTAARPPVPAGDVIGVSSAGELRSALRSPRRDLVVRLAPGTYVLTPSAAVDSTCGNCENPDTSIPMTVGLLVSGRGVRIEGPKDGAAVIVTRAGYGVYFKDCEDCALERVTVTGGVRDESGAATDAGIVVTRGSVAIRDCVVGENLGDSLAVAAHVVGIMGICGREGARLTVERCEIVRNSWDGIALYRDASAVIQNNLIDGIDQAGVGVGGGRGVGIGVTWNGRATIERNVVRNYWKGIGAFVDADVVVRSNLVERMRTWGISYWDADKGRPRAVIEKNVVYDCGACGIAITRQAPFAPDEPRGKLVRNIVVHTGQNPKYDSPDYYCYQCALALHAVPEGFKIRDNVFHDNRTASDSLFNADVGREQFWRGRRSWVRVHRNIGIGVDERHRFYESAFLTRYARWWD